MHGSLCAAAGNCKEKEVLGSCTSDGGEGRLQEALLRGAPARQLLIHHHLIQRPAIRDLAERSNSLPQSKQISAARSEEQA